MQANLCEIKSALHWRRCYHLTLPNDIPDMQTSIVMNKYRVASGGNEPDPEACTLHIQHSRPASHRDERKACQGKAPMGVYTCNKNQSAAHSAGHHDCANWLTRCRHIGTRPPAGIGSLLDCGIVHRGKTAHHTKLRFQSKQHVPTNGRALEEQCMLIYAEKQAEHKQSKRLLAKVNSGHCLVHLCTSHHSFCLLSAHMCWGTQQCNLTQTATHAHLTLTYHFT